MAAHNNTATNTRMVMEHHQQCAELSHLVYGNDPIADTVFFDIPLSGGDHQRGIMNFKDAQKATICFEGTRALEAWVANVNFQQLELSTLCGLHKKPPPAAERDFKSKAAKCLETFFDYKTRVPAKKVGVHRGFFDMLFGALDELWPAFEEWQNLESAGKRRIYLTGHSQGAALATLFACCVMGAVDLEKFEVVLITFGSPRVLSKEAAREATRVLHRDSTRFVLCCEKMPWIRDPVTQVPLESMKYEHVGTTKLVSHDLEITETALTRFFDPKGKTLGKDVAKGNPLLKLHAMETYKGVLGAVGSAFREIKGGFKEAALLWASAVKTLAKVTSETVEQQYAEIKAVLETEGISKAREKVVGLNAVWLIPSIDEVFPEGDGTAIGDCLDNLAIAKDFAISVLKGLRNISALGVVAVEALNVTDLIMSLRELSNDVVENQKKLDALRVELITGTKKRPSCEQQTTAVLNRFKLDPNDKLIPEKVLEIRDRVGKCLQALEQLEKDILKGIKGATDLQKQAIAAALDIGTDSVSDAKALYQSKGGGVLELVCWVVKTALAAGSAYIAFKSAPNIIDAFTQQLVEVNTLRARANEMLRKLDEAGL